MYLTITRPNIIYMVNVQNSNHVGTSMSPLGELYELYHTSSEPQEEGSSIDDMVIFVSKLNLMLGMPVTREIINLLQAIAHILEVALILGCPRNRRWYHAPIRSKYQGRIKLYKRCYNFDHFSKISTSHRLLQCPCIEIIKLLSSSLEIPLFMSIQSTLRLTVSIFGTRLCLESSPPLMRYHLFSLWMSSQRD